MKAKDLKNSILQMAVEGKLVPQDPSDEPASVLLERIREEKHRLIDCMPVEKAHREAGCGVKAMQRIYCRLPMAPPMRRAWMPRDAC